MPALTASMELATKLSRGLACTSRGTPESFSTAAACLFVFATWGCGRACFSIWGLPARALRLRGVGLGSPWVFLVVAFDPYILNLSNSTHVEPSIVGDAYVRCLAAVNACGWGGVCPSGRTGGLATGTLDSAYARRGLIINN